MKIEFLLSLKSLLKHKSVFKIKINTKKNINYRVVKIKNKKIESFEYKIKIPNFKKYNISILSKSSTLKEIAPLKIRFSRFLYFIIKFDIKNEFVINNISKIFFSFEQLLDKFNYNFPNYYIEKNINNIFRIISYNEDLINEKNFKELITDLENYLLFINKEISINIKTFREEENDE